MAIPETWDKTKEHARWSAATGTWERVEYWRGLSGSAGVTFWEWLANFTGYTSLDYDKTAIGGDGTGIIEAEIGFAIQSPDGESVEPSDPTYGLVERVWEKYVKKEQREIQFHPLANDLNAVSPTWVAGIMQATRTYNTDLRAWQKLSALVWEANDPYHIDNGQTPVEPPDATPAPNIEWYIAMCVPYLSAESTTHIPLTPDQWRIHRWIFREYAKDTKASSPYDVPVLRRTDTVLTVANPALWLANEDVGRIMTFQTLQSREASMALALLLNAGQLQAWHFIKQAPTQAQTTNGWFRMEQEYVGIERPTDDDIMRSGGDIL